MSKADNEHDYHGPLLIRVQGASDRQVRAMISGLADEARDRNRRLTLHALPPYAERQGTYIVTEEDAHGKTVGTEGT